MHGTTVEIRIASVDDVAALSEIGQRSFRLAYEGTCSDEDLSAHLAENFSEAVIRDELRLAGRTYLLAALNASPAAMVKLRESNRPRVIPDTNVIEIQQFYVSPDHQRSGLGSRLMHATLAHAKRKSFNGVWLSVWERADWAIRFYSQHWFTAVGTADYALGSTIYNDFLMWCPVTQVDLE